MFIFQNINLHVTMTLQQNIRLILHYKNEY